MGTAPLPIVAEFADVDLGDDRLNRRLLLLAQGLARDPELSLPDALEHGAELEGAYRFFSNPRVEAEAILRPHVGAVAARLEAVERALAIHDSTEFVFGGRVARDGLEGDRFRAHFCLAVSAEGRREPFGLLAIDSWTRQEKRGVRTTEERRKDDSRESKRWLAQSIDVEKEVHGTTLIHVEDREADIYESLFTRVGLGMHFIVRAQNYRKLELVEGNPTILEHMRAQPRICERDAVLSRRQGTTPSAKSKSAYQDRDGRSARLAFAAAPVVIRRPKYDAGNDEVPAQLAVNAVHVIEMDPPEGEQIVEWLLVTTEPIASVSEVEFIVDSYRARWVIEEYFKALKTGCAYESRQLESYDALRRALSIFAVVAWRLLWMRFLAQHAPSASAALVATEAERAVLVAQKRMDRDGNVGDFLNAVAKLGGHIKNNGPPGWQVLWRGYRKLRDLAAGYELAQRSDQW